MKKLIVYIFFLALFLASCGTSKSMRHQPEIGSYNNTIPVVKKQSDTVFYTGNNFLLKNKQNLWELYVEGDPLERGLAIGSLTDSLLKKQEHIFFDKINELIPSNFKKSLLRNFLKWYNRKLYLNVDNEFQTEIYGISQYAPKDLNHIAPSFLRDLYLHGAHDIGHAVQDLAMVGCTSFAVWGNKSDDGSLILGRNFDFYAGDDFAKEKIVAFINPKDGYPFMMVTWPGMIGACSGMNAEGLTVTINAGKSKIPLIAKTPISIVTREILQYAKTIDEAIAIAKKRKVFVSESIMVGSANDNKAVLIEIAPDNLGVFEAPNGNEIICSNHFQSEGLKDNKRNLNQIKDSHSQYRFDRMTQLLNENQKITPQIAANILRNKEGIDNVPLGYGNEKAINQLLAHHGIVFKPAQRLVWVSASPYQLGEFVCYDLNTIFKSKKEETVPFVSLENQAMNISPDSFLKTEAYRNYVQFRIEDKKMDSFLAKKSNLPSDQYLGYYQSLNPDYWVVYYKAGLYFYKNKKYDLAQEQFEIALTKEVTSRVEREKISNYLKKTKRKR
ncbi:C45 family autoproteolytic acyltransferase/hydolase [Flavobacterium aquicola]|uniref:Acyl-CoA:6-aminopenicillanic acid acyl transferase n=1 Tax=Flavobacterium aquicola TaxID=1682742 RepID=A0A3E0ETN4_9FLAO|nr:C45 family peptidase [Flavobacterium aquicola]REH01562.1 acyl-CoA:6-aminopenicillanic acid acyl transferase [Flavobacterium aquicola]